MARFLFLGWRSRCGHLLYRRNQIFIGLWAARLKPEWESGFPSASSGQALAGRTARFGMTSIFCFQTISKCFKVSPNVWVLVLGFPSLKFSETGRRGGQESRFPSASSGQALTGRTARFGMTSIFCFQPRDGFTKCF